MVDDNPMEPTPESMGEKTPMGTVVRKFWTPKFRREILNIEKNLKRGICGAETVDGLPCRSHSKEKYFWYCYSHRPNPNETNSPLDELLPFISGDSSTTGLAQIERARDIELMDRPMLIRTFRQCNFCQIRSTCDRFLPDQHCTIQEDEFYGFVDTVRDDHDLRKIDMYVIYRAAQAFANSQYLMMAQNMVNVFSDEAKNIRVATVRESKEFRECLKDLGITRSERQKSIDRSKGLAIGAVKATAEVTVAQIMAEYSKRTLQEEAQRRRMNVIEDE